MNDATTTQDKDARWNGRPHDYPLPDNVPGKNYGFFGYEASCVDNAIVGDNVAQLSECIARGFVTPNSRTIANDTIRRRCVQVGAVRVEKYLADLGWPK